MKHEAFAKRFNLLCAESNAPTTQKELAEWLGVSQPAISKFKNGKILPDMEMAIVMAEKFGCCVDWLLTGRGDKYPVKLSDDLLDISGLTDEQKSHFKAFFYSISQSKDLKKASNGN